MMGKRIHIFLLSVLLVTFVTGCGGGGDNGGDSGGSALYTATTRVSEDPSGNDADDESYTPSISGDGRYVAFQSHATNIVSGVSNTVNIFVHDQSTGETTLVSVDSSGNPADNSSSSPSISSDGRYVAFDSIASNLVPGVSGQYSDVFVHDRNTGETTIVSVDSSGNPGSFHSNHPSISSDGRYVAFYSSATNLVSGHSGAYSDIFVHDRNTGETTIVSVDSLGTSGNGHSFNPSISSDGRYVAFQSYAASLVLGHSGGLSDIFVHDRNTGETTIVSVDSSGTQGNGHSYRPSISGDGMYIAFESEASNLVSVDSGGFSDIFVHDRNTGETTIVSVDSSGTQANYHGYNASISSDGRYVAFYSGAYNLVPGDSGDYIDIFVHDRNTGGTTRVNVDSAGNEADNESYNPSISGNGKYVAFESYATNLVTGDGNNYSDVFVSPAQ